MSAKIPKLRTTGEIAEELCSPFHKVVYVIKSRHIEPAVKIGPCRAFDDETFGRIRDELKKMSVARQRVEVA